MYENTQAETLERIKSCDLESLTEWLRQDAEINVCKNPKYGKLLGFRGDYVRVQEDIGVTYYHKNLINLKEGR